MNNKKRTKRRTAAPGPKWSLSKKEAQEVPPDVTKMQLVFVEHSGRKKEPRVVLRADLMIIEPSLGVGKPMTIATVVEPAGKKIVSVLVANVQYVRGGRVL